MSPPDLPSQIAKTGFVLENKIAQLLKSAHWKVISNSYYIDDTEESVREIDLVAYKVTKVKHLNVYTTLIISCKKSESELWALLARKLDLDDPDADLQPLHGWSNDKVVNHHLTRPETAKHYHEGMLTLGVTCALKTPAVEVFAFQEMNKCSGVPKNDKNIFAAVTSLMKAQAYEIGALPQRRKTPSVYQFNLISLMDTELVRLMFSEGPTTAISVNDEHYIARYIIKKRESISRIRFIQAGFFEKTLPDYGSLHSANCRWFETQLDAFYIDLVKDEQRVKVFIDDFRTRAMVQIVWRLRLNRQTVPELETLQIVWEKQKKILLISASWGEKGAEILNSNEILKTYITKLLKEIYRYSGPFVFDDDTFGL